VVWQGLGIIALLSVVTVLWSARLFARTIR
jgi:hypothetical protein